MDLNLSYNKIADEGARKLSKLLIKNQILTHLNLSNNAIGFDGSRFLAQVLKLNSTLEFISLKLNAIDDKAGAKFFKDLTYNTNMRVLDVEAITLDDDRQKTLSLSAGPQLSEGDLHGEQQLQRVRPGGHCRHPAD